MHITSQTFIKIGIASVVAIAAYIAIGAFFVHADASPVISTSIRNNSDVNTVVTSATIGANVVDVVHVSSSTSQTAPQGTVDFQVYGNTSCTGSPTTQSGVALVSGSATSS